VWTFAGAVLLHPLPATALAVVLPGHQRWRARRHSTSLHQRVVTIASAVLACLTAHTVAAPGLAMDAAAAGAGPPALTVGIAVVCHAAVHRGLAAATAHAAGVTGARDPRPCSPLPRPAWAGSPAPR
jgi:hypothetical protein